LFRKLTLSQFIEEQAIDRVHRLNQTVDVTVYRLSIHDSVEQKILELQEKKRALANAAIEGGKTMKNLSMHDIMSLFKRDAEYDYQHVDNGAEAEMFQKRKVLDNQQRSSQGSQSSADPRRKTGSSGYRRQEDNVYGRR
jgi:hypothetical protein